MLRETVARHPSLSMLCESTSSRSKVLRVVMFQHKSVRAYRGGTSGLQMLGKVNPMSCQRETPEGHQKLLGSSIPTV